MPGGLFRDNAHHDHPLPPLIDYATIRRVTQGWDDTNCSTSSWDLLGPLYLHICLYAEWP